MGGKSVQVQVSLNEGSSRDSNSHRITRNRSMHTHAHAHTRSCIAVHSNELSVYEFVAVIVLLISFTRLPAIESWRQMRTSHHAAGASEHAPWATAEIKGSQRISSVNGSVSVFSPIVSITCHGILMTPRCHRLWWGGSPQHDFRLRALRSRALGYCRNKRKETKESNE